VANEIEKREQNFLVSDDYAPELVVQRGVEIAQVLTNLIAESGMFHQIRGIKGAYVSTEGWQATCSMMRVFPNEEKNDCVLEAKYAENGEKLHGPAFSATVALTRADGTVISRASAQCGGPDDRPWDKRPAQACKSMAGTRAFNKAARFVFGWIVKAKTGTTKEGKEVAFEATPAEEMEAATKNDDLHVRKNTTIPAAPGTQGDTSVHPAQLGVINKLVSKRKLTPQQLGVLRKDIGVPQTGKIDTFQADAVIKALLEFS